jgi:[acyl-carrier-protein] S-malonyltransferase
MRGAAERFAEKLAVTELRRPQVPDVYTVEVRRHAEPDGIRSALQEQLYKPVRWADTVRAMIESGVTTIVECGPGKVLTSLNRRIARGPGLTMIAVDDPESLARAIAASQESPDA